jgi:uncharacterized lipoprotein YajG
MKKTFPITILIIATLLSACQNSPATTYNSPDQPKQEKASSEAKVSLTIDDQSGDNSTPASNDINSATPDGVAVK